VAISRGAVERLLNGHWPAHGDVIDQSPRGVAVLQQFSGLRAMVQADGRVIVSYMREAYVTEHDNSVRVTFDRRIRGYRYAGRGSLARVGRPAEPPVEGVVLELKFTDRFPIWMRQMVRTFNLERRSMAKYVACVSALRVPELMRL